MLQLIDVSTPCHSDINLHIAGSEAISLSGTSGSGKSLLLRAIADLDPHGGQILLSGESQDNTPAPDWRRQIGLLPSDYLFWGDITADSMIANDLPGVMLQRASLPGNIIDKPVNQLSSGERQRLALLRLLQIKPTCLLLDEPCSHLDPETTLKIEQLILEYQTMHDCPVIWVSHDKAQKARVANRHFSLDNGRLEEIAL